MNIKKYGGLAYFLLALPLLLLFRNIRLLLNNCFHATDLGIYQQAIFDIAYNLNLNPYITIRDVKILNDHFDPVIYVAALFVKVFGYTAENLIIFEFLWLILFFGLYLFIVKKEKAELPFYLIIALFSKGLLSAFLFPIHPTTWSAAIAFLLFYGMNKFKERYILLLIVSLCFFREAIPFCTFMLGLGLILNKRWMPGILTSLFSIGLLAFVFFGRPALMGPTISYGTDVLSLINWNLITAFNYKAFFKLFTPYLLTYGLLFRYLKWDVFRGSLGLCLAYLLPLFGMHFLTNNFHFQYGALFAAPFLGVFLSERIDKVLTKKELVIIALSFILTGMGSWTKVFKESFQTDLNKCIISKERNDEFKIAKSYLWALPSERTILSTGGAVPQVLKPNMQIYQAGIFSKKLDSYDYLLFEHNRSGDTFPFSNEEMEESKKNCQLEDHIYKNEWFVLIKDPSPKCFKGFLR